MKLIAKKLLPFLLCFALCIGLIPFAASAHEADEIYPDPNAEVTTLETVTEYNPIFSEHFTHEQIDALEEPSAIKGTKDIAATTEYAMTPAEAGAQLRNGMKTRQNQVVVNAAVPKSTFDEYGANTVEDLIWNQALTVTTNGEEGDYLSISWSRKSFSANYTTSSDGYYVLLTINYSFIYSTSMSQENEMKGRANETIGYFGFTQKTSAFEKIETIYNYVISNVSYTDDNNLDDPIYHTAYSAIVLKDAVCEGYAQLLYYMLWRCEIPCRIVSGGKHAWNLVWLRGQWYSIDATWDSNLGGTHTFFLRRFTMQVQQE
jgi:hypothetical protein